MLHTLLFLLPDLAFARRVTYFVVRLKLLVIAYIRYQYMKTPLPSTIFQVIVGRGVVFALGLWLGKVGTGG